MGLPQAEPVSDPSKRRNASEQDTSHVLHMRKTLIGQYPICPIRPRGPTLRPDTRSNRSWDLNVRLEQVRARCERLLAEVDLPVPFDMNEFCQRLGEQRERPVTLVPLNNTEAALASGAWVELA